MLKNEYINEAMDDQRQTQVEFVGHNHILPCLKFPVMNDSEFLYPDVMGELYGKNSSASQGIRKGTR